jgi:hypothetical protein
MSTICGHDRRAIVCALRGRIYGPLSDEYRTDAPILQASGGEEILAAYHSMRDAFAAVDDPAKLAEMLAERGRQLWFAERDAEIVDIDAPLPIPMYALAFCGRVVICVLAQTPRWERYTLTMPQARAILLEWLSIPNGAHAEAERALRGER